MTLLDHHMASNKAPPITHPAIQQKQLVHMIREGRMMIPPELAKRILAEATYPGQTRHLTIEGKQAIFTYAEMMRRNLWGLTDPISFAVFGDRLILINGHHRLSAVIDVGRPVEFRIAMNPISSDAGLKELYFRYDVTSRTRTVPQLLAVVKPAAGFDLSKSEIEAVYIATGIIINGFRSPSNAALTPEMAAKQRIIDLRMDACQPWWPIAEKIHAAVVNGEKTIRQKIFRAQTYAVALMTMKYQPEKATLFWKGVAENDGLRKGDPRRALVQDLVSRNISKGVINQGIISASVAWNYWYADKSLQMIKVVENAIIRVAGTPIGKGS